MAHRASKDRIDAVTRQLIGGQARPAASPVAGAPVAAGRAAHRLLIANRGEIAIRVIRAAKAYSRVADGASGIVTIAIYTAEDTKDALFAHTADEAHEVTSYTDAAAIVGLAKGVGATAVHPGYGFLSEDATFARLVVDAGLTWIGPSPALLELFGDKVRAKKLAKKAAVPVTRGSDRSFSDFPSLQSWLDGRPAEERLRFPLILKSTTGGGGRGIRPVFQAEELPSVFDQTLREATAFTTTPSVFVEEFLPSPKHLEVQFLGDAKGIRTVGPPRDCSIQRRRQKVVEFCPPVGLHPQLAQRLDLYAAQLLEHLDEPYLGAGTVEFLLPGPLDDPDTPIFFTELNPRIQVEHTVTEMVTGIDLVLCQLRLCLDGALLLSLLPPSLQATGTAIQARINLHPSTEGGSVVETYVEPIGAGVRVDSGLAVGMKISTAYDPMVAKLIVWTDQLEQPEQTSAQKRQGVVPKSTSFEAARRKLVAALDQLVISGKGVRTNVGYLKQLLNVEEYVHGDARTDLLEDDALEEVLWLLSSTDLDSGDLTVADGEDVAEPEVGSVVEVKSAIAGSITASFVERDRPFRKGQPLLVLTSMKMESFVVAPSDGYVVEAGRVGKGHVVKVGDLVCSFRPATLDASIPAVSSDPQESWAKELEEIDRRRELGRRLGGPKAVEAQRAAGRLNLRERIDLLLDRGTFFEFGKTAGQGFKDPESGALQDVIPGNFILGTGEIEKRRVVVGGEDFSIQGGSPNLAGLRKSIYTETLALDLLCPLVRLHEGGGGSVGGADNRRDQSNANQYRSPPSSAFEIPRFQSVAQVLSRVPVVSAAMGTVAGLPASRFAASHFCVMVANGNAQVITAGPKVVERALGYVTTKQELGGPAMHELSGVVDNFAGSEEDALRQIRRFLSFLPSNVFELPPRTAEVASRPPSELRELDSIVPRSRRQTFDMRRVLQLTFDENTFFEIGAGPKWGQTQITGLARLNGYPVAVMANDCRFLAGAMTADGAQKVTRFIEFAHQFRLPMISFVDEPGFDIGLDAERAGTIRWGTKAVLTAQNARIPWCSVIVRKLYGVAGAVHFAPKGYILTWPSFESGALPLESGVAVAFAKQIAASPDPEKTRMELEARFSRGLSPFPSAEVFGQHDLVRPAETREYLVAWIHRSWPLLSRLDPETVGLFGYRG
ncbi:carboxyl transferase domain-containing protein [Hyaloraphidium curvatum]|nr:carboxyl transferase domain-containing protein [Hyaloraphidium curvatum]